MKNSTHSYSSKGFTLIELLVVIAIIAVLAASGLTIGPNMIRNAKRVSTQATAVSVVNSIDQFFTDYSALPSSSNNPTEGAALVTSSGGTGVDVLRILAGEDLNSQNPKKIRYLNVKEANKGKDGIIYNGNAVSAMLDPWKQPYYIVLDYGYDEQITVNPGIPGTNVTLRGTRVAIYSLGVERPTTATAKTLAKTW